MKYRFCGNSGLQLPMISLGLWHNFGYVDNYATARDIIFHAFDKGIDRKSNTSELQSQR